MHFITFFLFILTATFGIYSLGIKLKYYFIFLFFLIIFLSFTILNLNRKKYKEKFNIMNSDLSTPLKRITESLVCQGNKMTEILNQKIKHKSSKNEIFKENDNFSMISSNIFKDKFQSENNFDPIFSTNQNKNFFSMNDQDFQEIKSKENIFSGNKFTMFDYKYPKIIKKEENIIEIGKKADVTITLDSTPRKNKKALRGDKFSIKNQVNLEERANRLY